MANWQTLLDKTILDHLQNAMTNALIQTTEAILTQEKHDAVIPMGTGRMQNMQTYVDHSAAARGLVAIVTDAPQARRLYFHPGYHFRRDRNANARGEWWEPWISGSRRHEAVFLFTASLRQAAKEFWI